MKLMHALSVAVAATLPSLVIAAATSPTPLLNAQQKAIDATALSLLREPAVVDAKAALVKRWQALQAGTLADGRATLDGAADEAVYDTLRAVAADDPSYPQVYWTVAPPYRYGDTLVPGSRFGGDNPDRIYRAFAANAAHRYEIRGHRATQPSLDEFRFEAITGSLAVGKPAASLTSADIDVATDGAFVISADATPANGRRNHLQLPPGTTTVLIRDTLADWAQQTPNQLTVKHLDGVAQQPRPRAALVHQAVEQIEATADGTTQFIDAAWKAPANEIKPFVRKLEWGVPGGVVAVNRFSLNDDEALLITLDPIGARYLGFQVTDPWLRSVNYWNRSSSLSNAQARANPDGSITYVLSTRDPGYANWLDTGGLHDGSLVLRWEAQTRSPEPDKAVRETRVVKLADLAKVLPAAAARVTPDQRRKLLAARLSAFERRLTP